VDKGFRGKAHHPPDVEVFTTGRRNLDSKLRRRSAIEPVIGHRKQEHRMQRNFLRGPLGDRMNALLSGCGFNLRKLYRFFYSAPLLKLQPQA
jgi:transposase, IS5 family